MKIITNKLKYLKDVDKIKKDLYANNISGAITGFEAILPNIESTHRINSELNKLKTTFTYMLEYFTKNFPDPQRKHIYTDLKRNLLHIADEIRENIKANNINNNNNIYFNYHQNTNLINLINTVTYDNIEDIFNHIWHTNFINSAEKKILIDFFNSNSNVNLKSTLISAIMLSLIRIFDENKFSILFELCHIPDTTISLRALVGIIIGLRLYQKRIKFYPQIISNFRLIQELPDNEENIKNIFLQLIKSKETKKIIKEFENDILPAMIKMQGEFHNINIEDLTTEKLMDDENPGWGNFFENNPDLLERMENFTKRQFDGSDIFSATLGNLKNFDFFEKKSSWFIPFSADNTIVRNSLNSVLEPNIINDFMTSFEKASYFCNSDKFSFCFHIKTITPQMRNIAIKMLMSEIDAAEDMIKQDNIANFTKKKSDIITQYIQDLYRFFNFNRHIEGIKNIFKVNLSIYNSKILEYFSNPQQILRNTAELYFSKKFYTEAISAFTKLIDLGINDPVVYEKLAFAYQKIKNFNLALEFYKKAELFDQNKLWLLKKIAFTNLKSGNYEQAIEYYKKIEAENNKDYSVINLLGNTYINLQKFDEALKCYFKADFFEPNNVVTMRSIAYCSLKLGKFEQAKKYAQKCIDTNSDKYDFMLMGNLNWIENNKTEAILFYKTAISDFDNFAEFRTNFNLNKEYLLENGISETDFYLMLDFLEMKHLEN